MKVPYGALALVISLLFLVVSIARSGVWDPHELDRADLARRIAIHVFGATELTIDGAPNQMPTLSDLGMGELPFTSMALGFKQFGLHDYAGRLPLALWAVLGALVLYVFLKRLLSPRAGLYGVLVLVTMPLYFMQARTMLGDIVTMASFALCFCGFAGALLDTSKNWRVGWFILGFGGALAGYLCRGLIIGIAAPCLAVGLTWVCVTGAGGFRPKVKKDWWFHLVGAGVLTIGAYAAFRGLSTLFEMGWPKPHPVQPLARLLGFELLRKPPVEGTFDLTIRDLGHALFPWSAFIPLAFGRLFAIPKSASAQDRRREIGLRVSLLLGAACCYGAYAVIAPYAGGLPFAGPALLAAIVAIVIFDFERGAKPSGPLAVGTVVLTLVLLFDIRKIPVKALSVFGVAEREFPKDFEASGSKMMIAAAAIFMALILLTWTEKGFETTRERLLAWYRGRVVAYRRALKELSSQFQGNLLFGAMVLEAALVGLGAMLFIGRKMGWPAVTKLPHLFTLAGLNAWWVLVVVPPVAIIIADLCRGVYAAWLRAVRLPRAAGTVVAALLAGGLLCFGYYPALAAQLSPKEALERYAKLHVRGEPLGVLGLRARVARFYSGGDEIVPLSSSRAALRWLTARSTRARPAPSPSGDEVPRRWLLLRAKDLGELNSLFRKKTRNNLPVLDDSSRQMLLASNRLGSARNLSWLQQCVSSEIPHVQHPVSATFEDKLVALGWEVVDSERKQVATVVPQSTFYLRFFYRVMKPIMRNYKAFIHVDGYRRRHNGDHDVLQGKYRMSYWQPGDVIIDEYKMVLEPNFMPGRYTVYYGFFQGKHRMKVTQGRHSENRVNGGHLTVR